MKTSTTPIAKETTCQKEEIKALLSKITDKTALAIELAGKFNVEPQTVRTHWFGPLTAVPKKHREDIIQLLKIKTQD